MSTRRTHRPVTTAAAAILAFGVLAGSAAAVLTTTSGTTQVSMSNRAETTETSYNGIGWNAVPNTQIQVTVPSGAARLVNARFTAESKCSGTSATSGQCRLRIIAQNSVSTVELDPAIPAPDYFVFDSDAAGAADDLMEANAVERSTRLGAGTWTIIVQRMVSASTTMFTLDDWHLAVELSAV